MTSAFTHDTAGAVAARCNTHGGKTITVSLVEQSTGKPLRGGSVKLQGQGVSTPWTLCNRDGSHTFPDLHTGQYTAKAFHHGFKFAPSGITKHGPTHITFHGFRKANVQFGVDSNQSGLDLSHCKAEGKAFIGRYLSDDGSGNDPPLEQEHVAKYGNHGFDLILIWEKGKYRALEGPDPYGNGRQDALDALAAMGRCGFAAPRTVYFTADFTVSQRQWLYDPPDVITGAPGPAGTVGELVMAYFNGIHDNFPAPLIGAYGTYETLRHLFDMHRIAYGWQMIFGAKGEQIDPRVKLYQYDIWPDQQPYGVAAEGGLDLDVAVGDIGAFRFTG